ncbi:MAG: hypothetical protein V6Z86_09380 [Hyphomicrobiales bacterium]
MASYEDYGSIEGRLEATTRKDPQQFTIHEAVCGEPIECYFGDDLMARALRCASKKVRVEVYGPILYGKDGTPLTVRAEEIVPFSSDRDIPNYKDVKGILAAYE